MGVVHGKNVERSEANNKLGLDNIDARVDKVNVEGLGRTKDDIIEQFVKELFMSKNFSEMLAKSHNVKNKLEDSGCFSKVEILLDTSSGPTATPGHGYEVTFVVQELKQFVGGVSTTIGLNNEGLIVATGRAPNILGRGERIQGEFSFGNKQTRLYNMTLSKPLFNKFNSNISSTLFAHEQEWPISKYKLGENGVVLDFSFFSMNNLKHSLQLEGVLRDLHVGNRYAAFEVRENAGSTMKCSLKHILAYDTRRSFIFPSSGILAKLTTEFAGVGGNIGFTKHDGQLQINIPLTEDVVIQGSIAGGCILPLQSSKKSISVCDLFFLGGPATFRGFEMRGAGPSTDGSFTGGKMYWSAGLNLFTPLPFRPSLQGYGDWFRTHVFANIGNLGELSTARGLEGLLSEARLAYGLGLALQLGHVARLEINYCFPTWTQDGDRAVHGIQIGLTTS